MAKRKKRVIGVSTADTLAGLSELAGKLSLPDDAFDGEIRDACDDAAELMYENVTGSVTLEKLEFLYSHGFDLERLRELIEEYSKGGGGNG